VNLSNIYPSAVDRIIIGILAPVLIWRGCLTTLDEFTIAGRLGYG